MQINFPIPKDSSHHQREATMVQAQEVLPA